MDILNMIADVKLEINELRQLEHLLSSDDFRRVYDSVQNKIELEYLVKLRDLKRIRDYVKRYQPLDEYTVKQLRQIAAGLRINNYNFMSKEQLTEEIRQCRMAESV